LTNPRSTTPSTTSMARSPFPPVRRRLRHGCLNRWMVRMLDKLRPGALFSVK
jgi:hypothetical protein